ncbi:glycosyltransferase [Bacteroides gallinaceum]|uniref:glycosyltransferase n=1 Tax=Bacteroides gallinaceum TaxID=1462571 RepID=UPI0025AAC697|nr:glycosyltransferase [Bacteroides gallinaceum]MDN0077835.1 glycosyltransferase [Bacteroides gallinaceum]
MKILIISHVSTHPVTAGNKKMILQYADLLRGLGHEVYFLHICLLSYKKGIRDKQLEEIRQTANYWKEYYIPYYEKSLHKIYTLWINRYRKYFSKGYFKCDDIYPKGLHRFVNELDKNMHFDACIVNYYMYSKILTHIHILRKALFTHDCFSYRNIVVGCKVDHATTPNEEAKAMQRAPFIFAMQEEEAAFFQRLSPHSKVLVNYSNYDYHKQSIVGNHNLLFLSGPNMYNINGLKWFVSDIYPQIIKSYPDVRLIIGGGICEEVRPLYKRNDHITLYGYVDDLDSFFRQGDVAINPTYQGTGLKIKTFESLSFDKATIVHPHSAIGVFKKYSAPLFISDTPQGWLDALNYIWSGKDVLSQIKSKNQLYISEMNEFVRTQYLHFLSE